MSSKKTLDLLKKVSVLYNGTKGFDNVLNKVKITQGGDGKCLAEFTVQPEHLNAIGGLHGGFTATLVDNVTTYALMTTDSHPGLSVNINVDYMKAVSEGEDVIIDASVIKAGKTLAFLECELKKKSDGTIIAKGSQTKFVGFD